MANLKAVATWVVLAGMALGAEVPPKGWVLAFSDEFEGKELEFPKWSVHDPYGGHARNRESQAWVPWAVTLEGGKLWLTGRREAARFDGQNREYTSGIVTTLGSFAQTYGRFEIRCRIPAGQGFESKFALLPIPSGEIPSIEVLDAIGSEPSKVSFADYYGDEKTERSFGDSWKGPDFSKEFHTFVVEWDKDKIVWMVDGVERLQSVNGVPHQPMYLAVSLAVGGNTAKWPDSTTQFPAVLEVEYVRVYRRP